MSTIRSSSHNDQDTRSLQVLLESFGSRFSLDDIAAAYSQANQNVNVAGEILLTKNTTQSHEDKTKGTISKLSSVNVPEVSRQEDSKAKLWKPKKCSVSIGTVSSVIGKEYISTKPLTNPPRERTKPVKIDSKDIPETELWGTEMPESNKGHISRVPTDVEEFIVKMLGEGFQASEDVIHNVLGICGYDVKKSTEKLLVLSDTKKYADGGISTEVMSQDDPQRQRSTPENQVELQGSSLSDASTTLAVSQEKNKAGQERKILEALFSGVERYEKETKVTRRVRERKVGAAGRPVMKPLEDPCKEKIVDVKRLSHTSTKQDEDEENEFNAQRKAVQEHWNAMKEYYGAAAEAFWKGETERAHRLMEKGHFFGQKAREADEKSIAKMIGVKEDNDSSCKEEEILTLNVREQEPREALSLLKRQLTYFSGSSFKYLRVELSDIKENTKTKRLIVKLLERESITWSEEDNGLVMMIRVDEIDPKSLSFAKK